MIAVIPDFSLAVNSRMFHSRNMILGELLRAWRIEHKLSRRKLALQIGIDHVTLSRIENGESGSIGLNNLQKIIAWMFRT